MQNVVYFANISISEIFCLTKCTFVYKNFNTLSTSSSMTPLILLNDLFTLIALSSYISNNVNPNLF